MIKTIIVHIRWHLWARRKLPADLSHYSRRAIKRAFIKAYR